VDQYSTEEEQLEALGRWWKENGRSTMIAVLFAVAAGFGWQAWQSDQVQKQDQASDIYQSLVRVMENPVTEVDPQESAQLAEQLQRDFSDSTYAQFAALRLAAMGVNEDRSAEAEELLRWVLAHSAKGTDIAQIAQLRLARVLASSGEVDQALAILNEGEAGTYGASYAVARGDVLFAEGRDDEARNAYRQALSLAGALGGVNLPALQQKLQSLTPIPASNPELGTAQVPAELGAEVSEAVEIVPEIGDASDGQGE